MPSDELFMIRDSELVEPFQNKPFVKSPPDLMNNFRKHVESVTRFCRYADILSPDQRQNAFQRALLLSLSGDRKGLYSYFHDYAVEKHGYDSKEAIRLAYMYVPGLSPSFDVLKELPSRFNILLDASKSGLALGEGIFEQDQKKFRRPYNCRDINSIGDSGLPKAASVLTADPSSDAYILRKLHDRAREVGESFMEIFRTSSGDYPDIQLIGPYEAANKFANDVFAKSGLDFFEDDLNRIRLHISEVFREWSTVTSLSTSKQKEKDYRRVAMLFAEPVMGITVTPNVEEIKASFAYFKYPKRMFAVSVAFRQLCEIKARASTGGMVPCTTDIDEMKTVSAACIRALKKSY